MDEKIGKTFSFSVPGKTTLIWVKDGEWVSEQDVWPSNPLRGMVLREIHVRPNDGEGVERWVIEDPTQPDEGHAMIFVGPGYATVC